MNWGGGLFMRCMVAAYYECFSKNVDVRVRFFAFCGSWSWQNMTANLNVLSAFQNELQLTSLNACMLPFIGQHFQNV